MDRTLIRWRSMATAVKNWPRAGSRLVPKLQYLSNRRVMSAGGLNLCATVSFMYFALTSVMPLANARTPQPEVRPAAFPDGLYLTDDEYGIKPLLIVEDGLWIDPYEWVRQHGIDKLNARFTEGKQFERNHINAKVAAINRLNLQETTLTEVLALRGQTEWAGGVVPDRRHMASQIADQKCKLTTSPDEKWSCASVVQIDWLRRCKAPSSRAVDAATELAGHCLAAITLPSTARVAFQWIPADLTGTPMPERKRIEEVMLAEFQALKLPVTQDKDFSSTNLLGAFAVSLKPNYRLLAGTSYSTVVPGLAASRARHMAGADLKRNDRQSTNTGYLYDLQSKRYVYVRQPKVLHPPSQSECKKGGIGTVYCPNSLPVGMLMQAEKVYTFWADEQRLGVHYPRRRQCKEIEGSSLSCPGIVIKAVSFTITEHHLQTWDSRDVYSTRPALSIEQQY